MALNENQLGAILSRSRQLCTPEADKKLNQYKGATNGRLNEDVDPNEYSDEWDNWNYDDPNAVNENARKPMPTMQYDERSAGNSAMDPKILKSMMEQRIDTRTNGSAALDSVTEKLARTPKPQMNEAMRQQNFVPQQSGGGNLDYNYLKYIIKECLNEYFANNQLNEGATLKQIGLSGGKIKLVDNKGNIYSANLELSGNIKDKKKTGN